MNRDPKDRPLWNAGYFVGRAYAALIRADVLNYTGARSATYEDMAVEDITKAAEALGYDLVKREQKQEAA